MKSPKALIESPTEPMHANPACHPPRDRLSAFLAAFSLSVRVVPPAARAAPAHLFVLASRDGHMRIVLRSQAAPRPRAAGKVLAAAVVDFGGADNPLLRALPDELVLDAAQDARAAALADFFIAEATAPRCGGPAALARIGELLVLLVLRQAVDAQAAQPGLLAGLGHPLLRRAVLAMLDAPGRRWPMEDLAEAAGMSRSRFMLEFRQCLGTTPGAFLSSWRLTLAQRQLQGGDKVKAVARRAGFGSTAAFSRAYSRAYQVPPTQTAPL
ncbi:MAG: helix-turn-helix domain-containing protein [Pseudomonadota bacterium]